MKFELVFVPSPGAGHLHAAVELAKLLTDRDDRLIITIIVIPSIFDGDTTSSSSTTKSEQRLRYTFLSINDKSNSDDPNPNFISHINCFIPKVRSTVAKLTDSAESESLRLAGFVVDMFCMDMIDVANEFGVPTYMFYTTNATCLGLQIHVQVLNDVEKIDVRELQDSNTTELEMPSLTRPLPLKCNPYVRANKEWSSIVLNQSRRFGETKGILINTFAELEPQAMKFLSSGDNFIPNTYAVGPILNLKTDGSDSADDKQFQILQWLDKQPAKSVLFLCFGSMGGFSEDQAKEIAIALERSGYRFLWSLRRAIPEGTMGSPGEFTNLEEILPEGFLKRTTEIGKIIGWAPQTAVLANPAIGGFVSHCGWNSTLESLWFGVPIATWPIYAEQHLNAFALVEELGIAVGIGNNFRGKQMSAETDFMTAEEIERGIRCVMEQDSDVRERVKEMSGKSHVALMDGGSSNAALVKFIEDVIENIS